MSAESEIDESTPLLSKEEVKETEGLKQRKPVTHLKHEKSEAERIAAMIEASADKAPPKLAAVLKTLGPAIRIIAKIFEFMLPIYIFIFKMLFKIYQVLPWEIFQAIMGLGLCFCGGTYLASIAAMEAFLTCGWDTTRKCLVSLSADFQAVWDKHKIDNELDEDGDGIADVDQISGQELAMRKFKMALVAVKDPEQVTEAAGGLYTAWVAVQATLRLQFAKTIAIGVSLGNIMRPMATKVGVPVLTHLVPKEYHHWIPTGINIIVKSIAVYVAWTIQKVISAVHSGLRGGTMFSRGLLAFALRKKWISFNDEDTYIDEVVGFAIAGVGIWFQFTHGFSLPFPLNIIMFPFDIVEWYIKYTLTE